MLSERTAKNYGKCKEKLTRIVQFLGEKLRIELHEDDEINFIQSETC